jgi:hypothetical protein
VITFQLRPGKIATMYFRLANGIEKFLHRVNSLV